MTPHISTPIPHPRFRLPILGDVLTIDREKFSQWGNTQFRELNTGIIELLAGKIRIVGLADAALIEEVNDEIRWEKKIGPSLNNLRALIGDGLFTAHNDEPNWLKAHNILMPAFTRASMRCYHDTMAATAAELVGAWKANTTDEMWIDIPAEANRLTIEMIGRAGVGYSFGKLTEPGENPLIAAIQRELHYARFVRRIPGYETLFGRKRKYQHDADLRYARSRVADIIEARRLNLTPEPGNDMLDIMLHSVDRASGDRLDNDNIINQIMTLLIAGSETSANTIAFALHFLSIYPDVAARARCEVDKLWPDPTAPNIDFDDVPKLRYLRRVIDETLRLWPVAPGYSRQARQDTSIGNGKYHFRTGDFVIVFLLAAHRSDAWGPDADEFNPDRFLPENLRKLPPHTYKPFGTGPRACIGRQFAFHEILLTLAAVLHHFDLEPSPGYHLSVSEPLTLKPAGFQLRLHQRRSHEGANNSLGS
ncbi:cytochrome P450 [Mycobacterium attenuatum]|uniref:cytochrome P450 n=1 Tax=Mycobacterium attenuatum TaxID=2341086 RepID=UPI000F016AC8|nr:cytochrome P450 [Mycobacterium attenuatum]VBA62333.1 Bifunctional cytochrome P450/NADPH--P450 reductase [Mycobacterium attenuatum]